MEEEERRKPGEVASAGEVRLRAVQRSRSKSASEKKHGSRKQWVRWKWTGRVRQQEGGDGGRRRMVGEALFEAWCRNYGVVV